MTSKEYEHLMEVKKNIFLSKEDPDFLKKYVKYRPHDGQKLYEYALEWKRKGHERNYLTYLSKAAKHGSFQAEKLLAQEGKRSSFRKVLPASSKPVTPIALYVWMTLFVVLFMLLLLLCGVYLFQKFLHSYEIEHHYYKKEQTIIHEEDTSLPLLPTSPPNYSKVDLQQMVMKNAITRYHQVNGSYPELGESLVQEAPNNWISFFPANLSYTRNSNGYELEVESIASVTSNAIPVLELHFYPDTYQLALTTSLGDNLVLFPIAKGNSPLPFTKSEVSMRVIQPNGGGGPLGTRGLALHDNYAIHGTNEPSSIGQNVSLGCVRMKNEDIEALYEYVSIGTPFFVQSGSPEPPLFQKGLPLLTSPSLVLNDSSEEQENYPFRTFDWKH